MFLILFRNTWGPYLYANSFLDDNQLAKAQKQADICQHYADIGSWDYATECWGTMEQLIGTETSDVSWYNILKYGGQDDWSITRTKRSKEEALGKIKKIMFGVIFRDCKWFRKSHNFRQFFVPNKQILCN